MKSTSPDSFQHSRHARLEGGELLLALRGELHHREADDLEAERLRVEERPVGLDDAGLLERPHPPEAGRRGEPDPTGEFDIGDAAVGLELFQDGPVYGIKASAHWALREWSCPG
jgi:hypothetical protein